METSTTRDGLEIIKQRFGVDARTDPIVQAYGEAFRNAQLIYDARQAAGMTQKELAEAISCDESVISALEDADFEGDSLSIVSRIADVLHLRICIELIPAEF